MVCGVSRETFPGGAGGRQGVWAGAAERAVAGSWQVGAADILQWDGNLLPSPALLLQGVCSPAHSP